MEPDLYTTESETKLTRIGQIYRIFGPYLKPYWIPISLAYATLLATIFMKLLKPWPLKLIFDYILLNKPMPDKVAYLNSIFGGNQLILLTVFCVGMVVIIIFTSLFTYIKTYLLSAAGQGATNDIRQGIFAHLQTLSLSSHGSTRTGDLVLRLTSDVNSLWQLMIGSVQKFATIVLTFFSTLAIMTWMDWRLTLLALGIIPPLYIATYYFSRKVQKAVKQKRLKEGEVASIIQETMTSMAVVQAFTQEKQEKKRFRKESKKSLQAGLEKARLSGAFGRLVSILHTCGLALVVWYGAWRVLGGELTPGDLIVITAYVGNLYKPIDGLSKLIVSYMTSLVSGERMLELVETGTRIKDAPEAIGAPAFRGEVSFEKVEFGYNSGGPVLKDLTFTAKPGHMVALVGSSGTGKSTVVNLLLRFVDPWEGRILIDGQDIRRFKLKSLRRQMSVVLQESILFRRTIRENIGYGKPKARFEEIVAAAKAAQIHDFIMNLPDGYDTILDERGGNLSGGQRQRVALARAILREAPILILDEPVTGLDAITEAQLNETLVRLMQGKTTFIIVHRLSTIRRADLILVIEEGKIVQQGTHTELLASSSHYRHLYELQDEKAESVGQEPPSLPYPAP